MTGEDDLACVQALMYTIDTGVSSLVDLLSFLPSLRFLTLEDGSCVTSLRELGSGARQLEVRARAQIFLLAITRPVHVHTVSPDHCTLYCCVRDARQILHLSGCNLLELDGIGALRRLKELHAPRNHVHDLEPLGTVTAPIEVLDLSQYER